MNSLPSFTLRLSMVPGGFTLVEVVIALGIFSFAIVAIVGLFSAGLNTNRESSDQIQAANFASLLISTRRALPTNTITNFALPVLNASRVSGTFQAGADGMTNGTTTYNLLYQLGTNATTGPHLASVYLMVWWPIGSPMPTNDPSRRYELTTQVALP